jgi:hypothetical protein
MKSDQVLQVIVTVLLSFAGWWLGYWSTLKRDRLSKRRDLRVQYLIESYRRLQAASNRPIEDPRALESAVADIQLFGSPEQAELARKFAREIAIHRHGDLAHLLASLKNDLRTELDLGVDPESPTHLRIDTADGGKG